MFRALVTLIQGLLLALGVLSPVDPSLTAVAVIAVAAVVVLAIAVQLHMTPQAYVGLPSRARRASERAVRPAQSNPDAAGHPRPRAPGFAASAA